MENIFQYVLLARFLGMWKDNWESQDSENPKKLKMHVIQWWLGREEGEGICRPTASPTIEMVLNSYEGSYAGDLQKYLIKEKCQPKELCG